MSLGRQRDYTGIAEKRKGKCLFVSGALDAKFCAIGEKLKQQSGSGWVVKIIPDAGHALIEEKPK